MQSLLLRLIKGDFGKLLIIAVLAMISLLLTFYIFSIRMGSQFLLIYQLIPHLYLIPLILVSLWYPKRGLQITILVTLTVFINSSLLAIAGYPIDPILSLLYSGLDIGLFVSVVLYAKDRHLVDMMIRSLMVRQFRPDGEVPDTESLLLRLDDPDEEVREEAVRHLGEVCEKRAVPYLVEKLADHSVFVRKAAVWSLGQIGDQKATQPLLQSLKDPDRNVRETAAEALGAIGKTDNRLLVLALKDPDWHIRMGSVIALRISGYTGDMEPFLPLLKDENRYVRRECVKTLGRVGDPAVVQYFAPVLADPDAGVRLRVTGALGRIGGKEAYNLLEKSLSDPEWEVRIKARKELDAMDLQEPLE